MRGIKKVAALILLATVTSLGAPQAFAGGVESPGIRTAGGVESPGLKGGVESPGLKGGVESPGLLGGVESPGFASLIVYLATALIG